MTRAILHSLLSAVFVSILASCGGGGGSAGIGGTGITSGGTITGFGSIFVNGVKYNTDAATVSGDLMRNKKVGVLDIPDHFEYMDPLLVDILKKRVPRYVPVQTEN